MRVMHQSVAVILSQGGARLDLAAFQEVPGALLVRAEFARGDFAACAAATLEHACSVTELMGALRPWAAQRGWSVTVAPLTRPR